jgi:hypothetical protein
VTLVVKQGADQVLEIPDVAINGVPFQPVGFTARAMARTLTRDPLVLAEWTTTTPLPAGKLGITLSVGLVSLDLPAAVTATWTWRRAKVQVELVDGLGRVARIADERVRVSPETTY